MIISPVTCYERRLYGWNSRKSGVALEVGEFIETTSAQSEQLLLGNNKMTCTMAAATGSNAEGEGTILFYNCDILSTTCVRGHIWEGYSKLGGHKWEPHNGRRSKWVLGAGGYWFPLGSQESNGRIWCPGQPVVGIWWSWLVTNTTTSLCSTARSTSPTRSHGAPQSPWIMLLTSMTGTIPALRCPKRDISKSGLRWNSIMRLCRFKSAAFAFI